MISGKSNVELITWQNATSTQINCLNIGCTHGDYTMLMATLGCYVDYFEKQTYSADLTCNNLTEMIHIHHAGIFYTNSTVSINDGSDKRSEVLTCLANPAK
jgi:hypothetical protein